jgi:hypothetical protein
MIQISADLAKLALLKSLLREYRAIMKKMQQ